MDENFGINDDRRRLYGRELCVESNKYNQAMLDIDDWHNDIFSCIIKEVLDLDNPTVSDEGITKGELHERNRVRFASGVFKAFFDEKLIDEKQYDQLFRNLRENISEDLLGPNQEVEKRYEKSVKLVKEMKREMFRRTAKPNEGSSSDDEEMV